MITVNEFYKSIFGQKVYKISLDAGCTCPNRDGNLGYGGCIFCSQSGSGDFTSSRKLTITEQVEQAKKLVDSKFSRKAARENSSENHKYIAYFQNFTNTYGNPEELYAKWKEALSCKGVVGLAIGTRPDCISPRILEIFGEISEQTYLQIELGLQTINEKTASFIHRGFTTEVYDEAVKKIHEFSPKVHIVTHIMFGLPQGTDPSRNISPLRLESAEQMLQTVSHAVSAGTNGIKITVLYVLKNTQLEKLYSEGLFQTLTMDEYFELLKQAVSIIPENIIIHRLTGDPPKSLLISPEWTTDKKRVLNKVNQILHNR